MEDKDIEELLRKSAENIDPGDFSVRYKAIKHKLKKHKAPTKRFNLRALATASLSVILVALIVLPFTITSMNVSTPTPEPPVQYFVDDLEYAFVDETKFYSELDNAKYEYANIDMEFASNFQLFITKTQLTKGGAVEYLDESDNPESYISIKFYGSDVLLHYNQYADYDLRYEVGGANIKYKRLKDTEEYEYAAYASYKNLTYIIDYVSLKDDITDLFNYMFT